MNYESPPKSQKWTIYTTDVNGNRL